MKHVYRTMIGLLVLDALLFALSGIFKDDKHGVRWALGGIGWFGFLLVSLVVIVLACFALARGARARRTTTA